MSQLNFQNAYNYALSPGEVTSVRSGPGYEISTSERGSFTYTYGAAGVTEFIIRQDATGGAIWVTGVAGSIDAATAAAYARSGDYIGFLDLASQGNDYLTGFNPRGGAGNDRFVYFSLGNGTIDGGSGTDVVTIASFERVQVTRTGETSFAFSSQGYDGQVYLTQAVNIERIAIGADVTAYDLNGTAGQSYRLYLTALGRTPDVNGLSDHVLARDRGLSLHDDAASFLASSEFALRSGSSLSNTTFVTTLYQNALHRAPDPVGLANWVGELDLGRIDRASVVVSFSESAEHHIQTDPVLVTGIHLDAQHLGIS